MRISEIRQRESLEATMAATIAPEFTRRAGENVEVGLAPCGPHAQRWLCSELLSCVFAERPGWEVREFVRRNFEHTPFFLRRVPQYALAQVVCRTAALEMTAKTLFWSSRPLPGAEKLLILPGNRRTRIFDFAAGTTRTWLKPGFSAAGSQREMAARALDGGPFIPLIGADEAGTWLEEPIVSGVPLARLPPWKSRRTAEQIALRKLFQWQKRHARSVSSEGYLASLGQRHGMFVSEAGGRFSELDRGQLDQAAAKLTRVAARRQSISVAMSHGDLQPGNIFVGDEGPPLLIDLEYAAERSAEYDPLVFGLAARLQAKHLQVGPELLQAVVRSLSETPWRIERADALPVLALFLLEELAWHLTNLVEGAFHSLPAPTQRFLAAIPNIAERLASDEHGA